MFSVFFEFWADRLAGDVVHQCFEPWRVSQKLHAPAKNLSKKENSANNVTWCWATENEHLPLLTSISVVATLLPSELKAIGPCNKKSGVKFG